VGVGATASAPFSSCPAANSFLPSGSLIANAPTVPKDPTRSAFARHHPKTYLGAHWIVGLLLSVACGWFFYAIAEDVPESGSMVHLDLAVTQWLQLHGNERGESIFLIVSRFGGPILVALLLGVGLFFILRADWRHLGVLIVTAGGGAALNTGLKTVFHRSRPVFAAEFPVSSWSFPSGHAMDSLIGYGLLAYWLGETFPRQRWVIRYVAGALIALIGFARIYLGVHYLSDVVAGFVAGTLWLTVCISGYEFAERRRIGSGGADEVPG
jgi:membrane-associated phospholipid phosphatase